MTVKKTEDSIMKDAEFMFLKNAKQVEIKTPKERDSIDLLELVCQLHSRSLMHQTKILHDAYVEARQELESRITNIESEKQKEAVEFGEWTRKHDLFIEFTISELYKQFKQKEDGDNSK